VPPFIHAHVELFGTFVTTRGFQALPSGDHSNVSEFAEFLLAAQITVMDVYPTVDRLFEKVSVLELELLPMEALLPPEKGGAGVELVDVLIFQLFEPVVDHPAGNVLTVPKVCV
jgi:hypothetical protein